MTTCPNGRAGPAPTYLAPGLAGTGWDPRTGMWREVMVEALQCQARQSGPPQTVSPGTGSSQG